MALQSHRSFFLGHPVVKIIFKLYLNETLNLYEMAEAGVGNLPGDDPLLILSVPVEGEEPVNLVYRI